MKLKFDTTLLKYVVTRFLMNFRNKSSKVVFFHSKYPLYENSKKFAKKISKIPKNLLKSQIFD